MFGCSQKSSLESWLQSGEYAPQDGARRFPVSQTDGVRWEVTIVLYGVGRCGQAAVSLLYWQFFFGCCAQELYIDVLIVLLL